MRFSLWILVQKLSSHLDSLGLDHSCRLPKQVLQISQPLRSTHHGEIPKSLRLLASIGYAGALLQHMQM
jgi:hypothetical protein